MIVSQAMRPIHSLAHHGNAANVEDKTKQNKNSLLGIEIYSHVIFFIVLSSKLAAFPRTCKGFIKRSPHFFILYYLYCSQFEGMGLKQKRTSTNPNLKNTTSNDTSILSGAKDHNLVLPTSSGLQ